MTNRQLLLSAVVGVALNFMLMLLPSILLGVPHLIWIDRRFLIFLLLISLWVLVEAIAGKHTSIHPIQSGTNWLPYIMSLAVLFLLLSSLAERTITGVTPFNLFAVLGAIMMLGGVLLRYLAIRTLGAYFLDEVRVISGHVLITTGVYRHLRHPSEAGNLCIALGSALLLGSRIGLMIGVCIVLPIVLYRIKLEDQLLRQNFPTEFAEYSKTVRSLLPL